MASKFGMTVDLYMAYHAHVLSTCLSVLSEHIGFVTVHPLALPHSISVHISFQHSDVSVTVQLLIISSKTQLQRCCLNTYIIIIIIIITIVINYHRCGYCYDYDDDYDDD